MKSKFIIKVFSIVLIVFLLVGCSILICEYYFFQPVYTYKPNLMASLNEEYINADNETLFYATAIKNSTSGVVGKFVEYKKEGNLHTWVFATEKLVYGSMEQPEFKIVSSEVDYMSENPIKPDTFEKDKTYLLILRQDKSLFLKEPQYALMGDVYIPIDNVNTATWSRGEIDYGFLANGSKVIEYYHKLATTRGFCENPFVIESFGDVDLDYVVKNSKVILKVHVVGKSSDSVYRDQSNYQVKILEILKGENHIADDGSAYLISAFKDSLEKDKDYIITLSLISPQEKDSVFTQSALNGIIPIEDAETVKNVYEWLDIK